MCGIGGILTTGKNEQIATAIARVREALQHRGPDDSGIYVSRDRRAALTHTRLSILDLSAAGRQPMVTLDRRFYITFNGEIYNFRELRQTLLESGETFQSQTDTEVILKLYQREGARCLDRLQGMFAFAIWDDWQKTGFLARDPLGIKPLYYRHIGGTLVFASELRGILASGWVPSPQLDGAGLYGYLARGSVPEPHTLIEGIRCLPAGYYCFWQEGQLTETRYWQLQFVPQAVTEAEAIACIRSGFQTAIARHLVSDVPVGIFLSGGIDSTAVLASARQTQTGDLKTYSIAFAEAEWNEGDLARKTARHFSTDHTEYQLSSAEARSLLLQFLARLDQPTIDGFNTFCVAKLARESGTKVVLSGLGGDELFGGYPSFAKIPKMLNWSRHLHRIPGLSLAVGKGLEAWGRSPKLRRLGDFLQYQPTPLAAYLALRGIFSTAEMAAIARRHFPEVEMRVPAGDLLSAEAEFPSLADRISWLELSQYMRNQLLRDSDVMSMAWGLELRVPFVDRVFIETIATLPSELRIAPQKQWLARSLPEIPEWVLNRPKRGFSFPFDRWLETDLWREFSAVTLPSKLPHEPWYRRWSLFILQQWWQQLRSQC